MKIDKFMDDVNKMYAKHFVQVKKVEMNEKDYKELCEELYSKYTYYGEGKKVFIEKYEPSFKMSFSFGQVEVVEDKTLEDKREEKVWYFHEKNEDL